MLVRIRTVLLPPAIFPSVENQQMSSLSLADALQKRAFDRLGRGRAPDALRDLHRALALRRLSLGEVSFEVANTLTIIASLWAIEQSDAERAATLWQQAIRIYEKLHSDLLNTDGENTRDVALGLKGNLENLALYWHEKGCYPESERLFRRAMEVLERVFGADASNMLCNNDIFSDVLAKQRNTPQSHT